MLSSNLLIRSLIGVQKNDLISWLLENAPESELNIRALTMQILIINFAAIHTTSTVRYSMLPLGGRFYSYDFIWPVDFYEHFLFSCGTSRACRTPTSRNRERCQGGGMD